MSTQFELQLKTESNYMPFCFARDIYEELEIFIMG